MCNKMPHIFILAGEKKKQTNWQNEEIKNQIAKKKKYKTIYCKANNYIRYKKQIIIVKEANMEAWEKFGKNKLEENSKSNHKLFYKVLKNVRNGRK